MHYFWHGVFLASLLDLLMVNLPGGLLIISVSVGNYAENDVTAVSSEELSAVLFVGK